MSQLSRGKLVRDSSLLPPVGSKELNSSCWALWQTSLPTEPSCCPPPHLPFAGGGRDTGSLYIALFVLELAM